MNNKHITINGRTYIYCEDNATEELLTTSNGFIWNSYATTATDIELNYAEQSIEEAQYVNNYINR